MATTTSTSTQVGDISTAPVTAPVGAAKKSSDPSSMIDKDTFLKLLVAQLQHQDPMSPQDSSQWTAQMAQFSTVEQLTNLAKSTASSAKESSMAQAVALIGHDVDYIGTDGSTVHGTVQQVDVSGDTPTLTIDGVSGILTNSLSDVA
jgi:flagellar basal-body rod modification protein FlgD